MLWRLQAACAFLYIVGLTFSITVWQYSLVAALLITVVRFIIEPSQRALLPELRWPAVIILPYVVWTMISAIVMNSPGARFAGVSEEWLFLAIPVIWSVVLTSPARFLSVSFRTTAIAVIVITVAMGMSYYFGLNLLRPHDPNFALSGQASGSFGLSLTFAEVFLGLGGLFLLVAIFKIQGRRETSLFWLAAIAALTSIVMSSSRTATAAVICISVGCALFFWRRITSVTRLVLMLLPVAAVAVSLLASGYFLQRMSEHLTRDVGSEYSGSRQFIWSRTVDMIATHPVFGVGPDGFARDYATRLPAGTLPQHFFDHAHSDFLNMTATRGIAGGVLYLLMWGLVMMRGVHLCRREWGTQTFLSTLRLGAVVGCIGLVICGITEAIFVDEEVRGVIMLLWALLLLPAGLVKSEVHDNSNQIHISNK